MSALPAFSPDEISAFVERDDLPVPFAAADADMPLLHVDPAFERLTGHDATSCLGRNCRLWQGPSGGPVVVARVRAGIEAREFELIPLTDHRADGVEFTNGLLVGPVVGADGETLAPVGMQWNVGEILERRRVRSGEDHREASGSGVRLEHFERLAFAGTESLLTPGKRAGSTARSTTCRSVSDRSPAPFPQERPRVKLACFRFPSIGECRRWSGYPFVECKFFPFGELSRRPGDKVTRS